MRAIVQPAKPLADSPSDPDAFADELITFCRDRIAHYKCPTTVAIVDTLPRLPTGKIARRLLDDWIRAPFAQDELSRTGT